MQIPIPKYLESCWNWATVVETEIGFQYTTWNGKNILSEKMLLEKKIIFFFYKTSQISGIFKSPISCHK